MSELKHGKIKTVWKYTLINGLNEIRIPVGGKVLTGQSQPDFLGDRFSIDKPRIWVLVDNQTKDMETRWFSVVDTGQWVSTVDGEELIYVGTYQLDEGQTIKHIFEHSACPR